MCPGHHCPLLWMFRCAIEFVGFQGHTANGAAAEVGTEAERDEEEKGEARTNPESKEKAQVGPTCCVCTNRGTPVPPNWTCCTPTLGTF